MAVGKDWHRRLPAALHLATVISAAKDAGSYEEQPMSAHRAAWLAGRVARLSRVQKAVPATARDYFGPPELRKAIPLMAAANIASMVLPAAASSRWGQRAIAWGTRTALGAGRKIGRLTGIGVRARKVTMPGPTLGGAAGYKQKAGVGAFGKFRRNPARAALGLNRHVYANRGSYALATGGALGGYEADQQWRRATPKQRMMGDVG